jgi:hypothetical protein
MTHKLRQRPPYRSTLRVSGVDRIDRGNRLPTAGVIEISRPCLDEPIERLGYSQSCCPRPNAIHTPASPSNCCPLQREMSRRAGPRKRSYQSRWYRCAPTARAYAALWQRLKRQDVPSTGAADAGWSRARNPIVSQRNEVARPKVPLIRLYRVGINYNPIGLCRRLQYHLVFGCEMQIRG